MSFCSWVAWLKYVTKSYIKETGNFLEMLKNLCNIPSNAILVTAYVAGPYPSMPHDADLQALFDLQSCEFRRNDRQRNPIY